MRKQRGLNKHAVNVSIRISNFSFFIFIPPFCREYFTPRFFICQEINKFKNLKKACASHKVLSITRWNDVIFKSVLLIYFKKIVQNIKPK